MKELEMQVGKVSGDVQFALKTLFCYFDKAQGAELQFAFKKA